MPLPSTLHLCIPPHHSPYRIILWLYISLCPTRSLTNTALHPSTLPHSSHVHTPHSCLAVLVSSSHSRPYPHSTLLLPPPHPCLLYFPCMQRIPKWFKMDSGVAGKFRENVFELLFYSITWLWELRVIVWNPNNLFIDLGSHFRSK